MARVLTNNTGFSYCVESSLGVASTSGWRTLEPNDVTKFGAEIKTVARKPISKNRQNRKGVISDLDSPVEFKADATLSHLEDFIEGFVFSTATNNDGTFEGAAATSGGYTIPAATAAQGAKFQYTSGGPISLVYARGYATAANNGLKALSADLVSTDVLLAVAGNSAETPPTNAVVELCGIRAEAGDLALSITAASSGVHGRIGSLTSGNNTSTHHVDFTTLGLTKGQYIFVGGLTATNRLSASLGVYSYGYARITAIAAATLTLDRLDASLVAGDGTDYATPTPNKVAVDLLFGRYCRNVAVDDTAYLERSYQFEAAWANLDTGGAAMYSYAKGNYANDLAFDLPLSNKADIVFGFIGTDTDSPVAAGSRKTGASTAIAPVKQTALNTTADIARLIVHGVDETGVSTDFTKLTVTLKNNVSAEKVIGTLGAKYLNTGYFEVDLKGDVVFTSPDVLAAIRANTTLGMVMGMKNGDGAVWFDVPSVTIGDGKPSLKLNESVKLAITGLAFIDPILSTSLGVSFFPVVP